MIKVMKFGGTSLGSGEAMDRTSDIIRNEPAKKAVVVSAMSGVTNALIAAMNDSRNRATRHGRQASGEAHAGRHREDGREQHGGVPGQAGRPAGETARPARVLSQEGGPHHDPGCRPILGGEALLADAHVHPPVEGRGSGADAVRGGRHRGHRHAGQRHRRPDGHVQEPHGDHRADDR